MHLCGICKCPSGDFMLLLEGSFLFWFWILWMCLYRKDKRSERGREKHKCDYVLVNVIVMSWCVYVMIDAVDCTFTLFMRYTSVGMLICICVRLLFRVYLWWEVYLWMPGACLPLLVSVECDTAINGCVVLGWLALQHVYSLSSGICLYYVYSALHFWYECDYRHLCVCMYLSFPVIINFGTYSQHICLRYIFLLCWVWVMWLKTQFRLGSSGLASGFSVEL